VPLATTEGTLVASYNRGMRLLTACGGVKVTVVEQFMQRAPMFFFDDAREARQFGAWVEARIEEIRRAAESTSRIAKLFIATGQDVATVSESHAAIVYTQLEPNGDYYWSITLPSLICATYGGGTGLATQREMLEMLDCYRPGKANKLAEIIGATVLAGETSLSGAVLAGDWVSSHDQLGRNRP